MRIRVIAINIYVTDGASEKHDDDVIDVVAVTCLKQLLLLTSTHCVMLMH